MTTSKQNENEAGKPEFRFFNPKGIRNIGDAAPSIDGETQGMANSFGSEMGRAAESLASGDATQIKAQLGQQLLEAERIIADAERLGIPHNVNLAALRQAAMLDSPSGVDVYNALAAADSARQLDAHVTQQQILSGGQAVGGMLAGATFLASDIYQEALVSLKTGNFESLKNRMDDIVTSGKGIMAHLNFLETAADGTKIDSKIQHIAAMPEQFLPQQGLPNFGVTSGQGIV